MILYPAIDLKGGRCVRLTQGDFNRATTYNEDPADQARRFAEAGFGWIHVVDLDGSLAGAPVNADAVAAILKTVGVPVQLGGGVRSLAQVEKWMEAGVSRLILGTAAVTDPTFVKAAASRYPEQIAVGLDIRAGEIAVQGWSHNTGRGAVEVARQFEDAGVCALVVTDIGRDGMLSGVDVEVCGRVADSVDIPVIAAGGVTSADDITALRRRPGTPIAGAVLGKALYAGTLTPDAALEAAYGRTAC